MFSTKCLILLAPQQFRIKEPTTIFFFFPPLEFSNNLLVYVPTLLSRSAALPDTLMPYKQFTNTGVNIWLSIFFTETKYMFISINIPKNDRKLNSRRSILSHMNITC